MANYDKRLDRSTGKYATLKELTAAIMKLHIGKQHSRAHMGRIVGVSGATVTRVINENTPREVNVDLNAIFNKLWVMTSPPEDDEPCGKY
jgi:hypothetical protein